MSYYDNDGDSPRDSSSSSSSSSIANATVTASPSLHSPPPPPPTVFTFPPEISFDRMMEKVATDGMVPDPADPTLFTIASHLAKERFNLPTMMNMSRLIAACYTGELPFVRALVEAGAEVNAEARLDNPLPGNVSFLALQSQSVTSTYHTPVAYPSPLRMARYKGHKEILHYLCTHPKIHAEEAMIGACEYGLDDIVCLLMKGAENCKCRPSPTHLQAAAQYNRLNVVKALLDPSTGMTYDPLLPPEYRRSHPSHYSLITSYSLGRALCLATAEGHHEMVQLLLDHKAPKDGVVGAYASEVPLFIAASEGEKALETLKVLIRAGANPNHNATYMREEASAIRSAVQANNVEGLKYLLSVGATRGLNVGLSEAAKKGNSEIIELLLTAGADWNTTDSQGRTLLYKVTFAGCYPVVQKLLDKGADPNTLSPCGEEGSALSVTRESPLLAACAKGYNDILKLLLQYNADPTFKIHNLRTPLILLATNGNYEGLRTYIDIYYHVPTDYPNENNSSNGSISIVPRTNLKIPPLQRTEIQDALQQACIVGSYPCIRLLLDIGGELNPTAPTIPPLLQCSIYGHDECIQYLLKKGADITATSSSGKTALDLVRLYGTGPRIRKQRTIEILENAYQEHQKGMEEARMIAEALDQAGE